MIRKRQPRKGGETFTWVLEGGETMVRCKGCGAVVSVNAWWKHSCKKDDDSQSPTG